MSDADNPVDADRGSALLAACTRGEVQAVEQLLDGRADPNVAATVDDGGGGALHAACARGHEHVVAMLLVAGARPEGRDEDGLTPPERALQQGHHDCVTVIETHRRLEDSRALRQLTDAHELDTQQHEVALRKLSAEAAQNAEAMAALEDQYLAAVHSSEAIEASLRTELASVSAKLARFTMEGSAQVSAEDASAWGTKQNLRAQLAAETRARAALADMLSERRRAYDILAEKYKELRTMNRAQRDENAALTAELERMRTAAAATDKQLLTEQSTSESELTFARLECEELRYELAEVSAAADAKISEQAARISLLERELNTHQLKKSQMLPRPSDSIVPDELDAYTADAASLPGETSQEHTIAARELAERVLAKHPARASPGSGLSGVARSPGAAGGTRKNTTAKSSSAVLSAEMNLHLHSRYDERWSSSPNRRLLQSLASRRSPQRREAPMAASQATRAASTSATDIIEQIRRQRPRSTATKNTDGNR